MPSVFTPTLPTPSTASFLVTTTCAIAAILTCCSKGVSASPYNEGMLRSVIPILVLTCGAARADVIPMTLRQAVDTALKQNPDVTLARLDEQKARMAVRVARDPFVPRIIVGSGLAYSNGFPMSIEGAA